MATQPMAITIIAVDNRAIYLAGLTQILARTPGFKLLCECTSAQQALGAAREFKPDVMMVSSRILRDGGSDFLQGLKGRSRTTRIVVLTGENSTAQAARIARQGADGVLFEGSAPEAFLQCIRSVARGKSGAEQTTGDNVFQRLDQNELEASPSVNQLTRRQREIAHLAAAGMRNKEIGKKLFIDEGTVKSHLHNVFSILQVNGRHALANLLRTTDRQVT